MKRYLPFFCIALIFLLIKLGGVSIRLSDSNIYFYTAYQLLQGEILYKDIFFTNFPLLPYISTVYFLLFAGNLQLYYLTPTLEAIGVALLIYLIVNKKTTNLLISTCSSAVYLFSFIVLTTSDHQSGVFLASLFGIVGYYFLEVKKSGKSGVFFGLSIMTKAYFLPLVIAAIVTLLVKHRKKLFPFIGFFSLTVFFVLLPSLLFASMDMYHNIIEYSLTRSQGISKFNILRFFTIHDALLVVVFLYGLIRIKKDLFMGTLAATSLIFILFYKDIYYLYLNFLIPYLGISFSSLYLSIQHRFSLQRFILPTVLLVIFLINMIIYLNSFQSLQKIPNINEITTFLKKQPETIIYGVNDTAPALAYLSEKKLLNDIVDTNENIFRKGYLDSSLLTKDAIQQNSLLVSHGVSYPQFNIEDPLVNGMFDKDLVLSSCSVIGSFPVTTEGIVNKVTILRCSTEKNP